MEYILELIIILCVITYQIYHSFMVHRTINELKRIFEDPLKVKNGYIEKAILNKHDEVLENIVFFNENEELSSHDAFGDKDVVKVSITETTSENKIILRIQNAINNYLLNNYGAAVNFSIIKDMIDREVDVKDEEISQSLPTPLYLGLAATMFGIIFGLIAMPAINGSNFSEGINTLIGGVKLAMWGSLTGLACTTLLSSFFYKKAKKVTLENKNEQLSYLQAKLLPELIRAEDTGVSGLKASLDRFAREATKITENVNNASIRTGINIKAQQDILAKVDRINMVKVSKINLDLFDRLEANMEAFNNFSEFLVVMEKISANLKDFALKTTNIDAISKQILSTFHESRQLNQFLTSHLEKIENSGITAVGAVTMSDTHFRKAIDILDSNLNESLEKLNIEIQERISSMNKLSDDAETTLKESYEEIIQKLNSIVSHHLDEFNTALSNAVPKFEKLDELVLIKESIENANRILIDNGNKNNQLLIDSFRELNSTLQTKIKYSPKEISTDDLESNSQNTNKDEKKRPQFDYDDSDNVYGSKNHKPYGLIHVWKSIFKNLRNV